MSHEPQWCPVIRPSRQDFQRPFMDFVAGVFAKNPDLPMFKVVPPSGWRARRTKFPDLKDIQVKTPIRQHVFGTKGAYRCILVEQKETSVEEFKRQALEEAKKQMPSLQRKVKDSDPNDGDAVLERSFWSGVTLNPPLYGADTPVSFFDPKLPYGWNLRDLGDLLKEKEVPEIPGVTTPMTYFGMWRSFFAWHKEDADLLSINFLHFGAPKLWYCISPKDQAKFERMAQGLFPQLYQSCHAFIRHKDILLSPSLLRAHGIPFTQAKQEEGEFIVLNASAYHSGFNMGFNCAEAINFATPAWIQAGKQAINCTCRKDSVHISMKLFDPNWTDDDSDSEDDESDDDESEEDESEEEVQEEKVQRKPRKASAKRLASEEVDKGRERGTKRPRTSKVISEVKVTTPRSVPRRPSGTPRTPRAQKKGGKIAAGAAKDPASLTTRRNIRAWGSERGRPTTPQIKLSEEQRQNMLDRDEVSGKPLAIVGDDANGCKFFCLVQRVNRSASTKGNVVLRWLREDSDGLYRPVPTYWEERPDALIGIRTQYLPDGPRRARTVRDVEEGPSGAAPMSGGPVRVSLRHKAIKGETPCSGGSGWKLLTLKSRILDTELLD